MEIRAHTINSFLFCSLLDGQYVCLRKPEQDPQKYVKGHGLPGSRR